MPTRAKAPATKPVAPNVEADMLRVLLQRIGNHAVNVSAEDMDALRGEIEDGLARRTRHDGCSVYPQCLDALLLAVDPVPQGKPADAIQQTRNEYFQDPKRPSTEPPGGPDPCGGLVGCLPRPTRVAAFGNRNWFPFDRALDDEQPRPLMGRPLIGDLVWLFYMERMGLFKILGAILDDYATRGRYPLLSQNPNAGILEVMVRLVKQGLSSTVRERDSTYRRCLGWTSEVGRKLGSEARPNEAFNTQFHKLIQLALEYYKDLRLADAIRGDLANAKPSVATLTSIKDTAKLLLDSLDPFAYGRSEANTLAGVAWAISALGITQKLVSSLGIPTNFTDPEKFIPAAYERLVLGRDPSSAESRRYTTHLEAARYGRRILLDLQALNLDDQENLKIWLMIAEESIEGYRTAYRTLTGMDLGAAGAPAVAQQV
jgi:hypothetical protein